MGQVGEHVWRGFAVLRFSRRDRWIGIRLGLEGVSEALGGDEIGFEARCRRGWEFEDCGDCNVATGVRMQELQLAAAISLGVSPAAD